MEKIVLTTVLSVMIFGIPAMSVCKIDKIKNCKPSQIKKESLDSKRSRHIENSPVLELLNEKDEVYHSASCEFGVCSPKPPKR